MSIVVSIQPSLVVTLVSCCVLVFLFPRSESMVICLFLLIRSILLGLEKVSPLSLFLPSIFVGRLRSFSLPSRSDSGRCLAMNGIDMTTTTTAIHVFLPSSLATKHNAKELENCTPTTSRFQWKFSMSVCHRVTSFTSCIVPIHVFIG